MLFPFAEMVFTNGLGPPAGRYVVRAPGTPAPPRADGAPIGPTLEPGSADVLVVRVDGAPAARRKLRGRRPTPVETDGSVLEVSLYVTTVVFGTRAFGDERAAQEAVRRWRADPAPARALADEALAVVNRAVRAYRAAAADPYVVEVVDGDPRVTRVGYGGEDVIEGSWTEALELPRLRPARVPRGEQLRPVGIVADVLAGRTTILDGEDVLLRAVLDLEQGRPAIAARQLLLALDVLAEGVGMPRERLEALADEAAGLPGLLADPDADPDARAGAEDDLVRLVTAAGDLVDRWHAS